MATLITDPALESELLAQRQAWGADKFDEVWDGVYVMAPLANDEHQFLMKELTMICGIAVDWAGLGQTRPGTNVSDQTADWAKNYRCPDVAVFLNDTKAENRGTYWYGGPDFCVEIVSHGDKALDKLPFYGKVGTRELLVIDRDPWAFTLFRLHDDQMQEVGKSTVEHSHILASEVVPLSWQLVRQDDGIAIKVAHVDGQQEWTVVIPT